MRYRRNQPIPTPVIVLQRIADSSKILTNMGLIYATLGEHQEAVRLFQEATSLDQYLAVAYAHSLSTFWRPHQSLPIPSTYRYFQSGVSNFLLGQYETAFREFDETLLYLRGNQTMYVFLGLGSVVKRSFLTTRLETTNNSASNSGSTRRRFSSIEGYAW
jgi:tetratricopeptide (TPR) repeat protein